VDLNRHGKLKTTPAAGEKETAVVATKMANFDNVKDCLVDFGVVPKYVDHSTLIKLFRSVKLWEWCVGERFLVDRMSHSLTVAATNAGAGGVGGSPENGSVVALSQVMNLDHSHVISEVIPFDYSVSLGNLSITSW
jgi:hypothetical protein